ncbi:MAG: DNA-directed RNA polymerase subunit omega [Clostridia bacterium]
MLSNPNVSEITPKVGNRYEAALALAKRARDIERKRVEEGDPIVKDSVDIAGIEIADEKVYVKFDGKYSIEPEKRKLIEDKIKNIEDIVKE